MVRMSRAAGYGRRRRSVIRLKNQGGLKAPGLRTRAEMKGRSGAVWGTRPMSGRHGGPYLGDIDPDGPGRQVEIPAMHMHPESYIEMVDQDRERAMTQRALQRAAREGGVKQPG